MTLNIEVEANGKSNVSNVVNDVANVANGVVDVVNDVVNIANDYELTDLDKAIYRFITVTGTL